MAALQQLTVCALLVVTSSALPVVDQGVFILQGISSCLNGTGYCILGNACTADIDFIRADTGHCDGLDSAFTPSVKFSCCRYNEQGKATSEAPTTVISDFTITGPDFLLEDVPILEHQENNEVPDDVDPSSLIDIVGVVTDMTGVLGLITQPYTRPTTPTTPSITTTTPRPTTAATTKQDATTTVTTTTTTIKPTTQRNSSHASISLSGLLNKITQSKVAATTSKPVDDSNSNGVSSGDEFVSMDQIQMDFNEETTLNSAKDTVQFVVENGKVIVKEHTSDSAVAEKDYLITNKVKNLKTKKVEVAGDAEPVPTTSAASVSNGLDEQASGEKTPAPILETKTIPLEILNNL